MAEFNGKYIKNEEFENIEPSNVMHGRKLAGCGSKIDIYEAIERCKIIEDVTMDSKQHQGLVEIESFHTSLEMVTNFNNDSITNRCTKVKYNNFEHVLKPSCLGNELFATPNKVLNFSIYNVIYPINVDVINKICKLHGKVVRILIYRKPSIVEALVEFYTLEDAVRVKQNLNGIEIYPGCCTLKIEYATENRVNVIQNNEDSVDFELIDIISQHPHLIPETSNTSLRTPINTCMGNRVLCAYFNHYYNNYNQNLFNNSDFLQYYHNITTGLFPAITLIYGLNMHFVNCDVLFNLLCNYGNVIKIKFLKSKKGSAMVEMGDFISMERMMRFLHNQVLFDILIQVRFSKYPTIMDVKKPFKLRDGSSSIKDFIKSPNNRFFSEEQTKKIRVFPPSNTLFYWNAPPNFTLSMFRSEFVKYNAIEPLEFLQLTNRDKSSSGLLQWNSIGDALNAIALCNHILIKHEGARFPYQLKLSFSEKSIHSRLLNVELMKMSYDCYNEEEENELHHDHEYTFANISETQVKPMKPIVNKVSELLENSLVDGPISLGSDLCIKSEPGLTYFMRPPVNIQHGSAIPNEKLNTTSTILGPPIIDLWSDDK